MKGDYLHNIDSPHGSVMSCQSLSPTTRSFVDPDKENMTYHRSVRFSSESRSSTRKSTETECKRDTSGSLSTTALSISHLSQGSSSMSQSAPPSSTIDLDDIPALPLATCRFPKLEECAHFHYERVNLGGIRIETIPCSEDDPCPTHCADSTDSEEGWICLKVRSHVNDPTPTDSIETVGEKSLNSSWTAEASEVCEWSLTRNSQNFLQLDDMLHRCIYDRKVSGLLNLSEEINAQLIGDRCAYTSLISDYVHHLSIIANDSINCGPILNWLQMDNKGHKLLVANEDSSSINTPAVAAAYSVRKYVSQARDEISFEVGDMISIIDMPGPQESVWWRGKRGFRVGFFPHHCVAVIGDKVPRHMTQPPPIVGSLAMTPIKPVLRKHGKLISLFRSFILSRPSRRSLKQQGILRERVFGCDLGEHLLNCGHEVPLVLIECARVIESRGAVNGIYRLSGGSGLTQRLRAAFDEGTAPPLHDPAVARDPHALASLLKMYFRELPNPLCTYQLYESFVSAVQCGSDESVRVKKMRDTVIKLPPPHYRTLSYLMRHLRRVSLLGDVTGMTARNMAIVWAPNLLRSPHSQHALHGVAVQAVVTEFLICFAEELFSEDQGESEEQGDSPYSSLVTLRSQDTARRPKSLPPNPPTKLLSLEEARRRGKSVTVPQAPPPIPSPSTLIAINTQLRPSTSMRPKYIEVGSGPNNLPQYHTVLDLPAPNKRGLKRSPSGWRGLFSRNKLRPRPTPPPTPEICVQLDVPMTHPLRPVKSCESLQSETDTLGPLTDKVSSQLKSHTRSASCDSYFEPWQAELADMRLRLSPQERDNNIFSEEDDTTLNVVNGLQGCQSISSCSEACSVEPSPRKTLQTLPEADRKCSQIEDQLSSIGYIDGESPVRIKPGPEKRHSDEWIAQATHTDIAKRVCKDRDSPKSILNDFPTSLGGVKLRERNSPRKTKNSSRYSGLHQPLNLTEKPVVIHTLTQNQARMSWHGVKDHSTLIKIDWPVESSVNGLTTSTLYSSPLSPIQPITPAFDPSESDSEHELKGCDSCNSDKKCLKCELKECADYENVKPDFKVGIPDREFGIILANYSLEPSPINSTDISYQNLNRLSAISTNSSTSDPSAKKFDAVNDDKHLGVMTSSHESSSSCSNMSSSKPGDELYECHNLTRPNYINLQSSSTSKSSSLSPLKSPLRSTISITYKSPTKSIKNEYEPLEAETPTNDSVYEDIKVDNNLSIVEEATVPEADASLPTQQACQPENFAGELITLDSPIEKREGNQIDVYSQVKFFRKSVREVNAMVLESPENREDINAYENMPFHSISTDKQNDYENIEITKHCSNTTDELSKQSNDNNDQNTLTDNNAKTQIENDNGNSCIINIQPITKNLNVRELAHRFESPTEQKSPFNFKISTLERNRDKKDETCKRDVTIKIPPPISPKTYNLAKSAGTARSLDENAFVKEFGCENTQYIDKRKSLEVKDGKKQAKYTPDMNLNLNMEQVRIDEEITPSIENKIALIQRNDDKKSDIKGILGIDSDKKLSRERIEKYKEERRNFLREKYSSQSFRSANPSEHLTRLKLKKNDEDLTKESQQIDDNLQKFERRNTVDLGQRIRFSLAKSANNLDTIKSPDEQKPLELEADTESSREIDSAPSISANYGRKEKVSPAYNIKDMAAIFEQKSQNSNG